MKIIKNLLFIVVLTSCMCKKDEKIQIKASSSRKQEHKVDKLFLDRWSPRAMSGEEIPNPQLMKLFEAARWAPSSFNEQPWRFIYAKHNTPHWNNLFNLLVDWNKKWCKNASALCVIVSKKTFTHNNQPNCTHSSDAGAAWENLALQASLDNLVVHGMSGFDYDKARKVLNIPLDYNVEMMLAIGKPGKIKDLPQEMKSKEKPSGRKPLKEIIFEGKM